VLTTEYIDDVFPGWLYHRALVINNLVHCPWFPNMLLPPKEFCQQAFWNAK